MKFLCLSLFFVALGANCFSQCSAFVFWSGGPPASGTTLTATGFIQTTNSVPVVNAGTFASNRPSYGYGTGTFRGLSYRSLRVIRGGANIIQSATTTFTLPVAMDSNVFHMRVSDVRGDGFNTETQRVQGFLNGVEVPATFDDAVNGGYAVGNVVYGDDNTTTPVQSALRIFFNGPVNQVVVTKLGIGDYVIIDLFSRCAIILPFTLSDFKAQLKNNTVILNWSVSEAWGFDAYKIEKSADGRIWSEIGSRPVTDFYLSANFYQFIDTKPLSGRNFYRLKSEDIDGQITYSDIVSVNNNSTTLKNSLVIGPNPVQNELIIQSKFEKISEVSVFSSDGRIILSQKPRSVNVTINTRNWKKGIYFLRLKQNNGIQEMIKILKD